ncbi:MAG TPA: hypothetical protein VJT09_18420 [Pyrinomonadaceae bacterium]|nr:hypothetical protein [Pyrinomonadaceae bacterium]
MMSAIFPLLLVLTSTLIPATPAVKVKRVALDQEFEIRVGEDARVGDEGLMISFSRVAEDSRCPQGVECIWAGNARVALRLTRGRSRAAWLNLNTGVEPKESAYRGYQVKLVKLNPYPKKGRGIRKRDYVATLMISRR